MRHKITVIMAAYEGEDYIGQQIDSVLSQTAPETIPERFLNSIRHGILRVFF